MITLDKFHEFTIRLSEHTSFHCDTPKELGELLNRILKPNGVITVKRESLDEYRQYELSLKKLCEDLAETVEKLQHPK